MENVAENKKVIFSGIQPSGNLTLGNYLGALKNWVKLQDEYDCFFCVVDLHAITVKQLPADLANRFNNAYSPTFKIPDPYIPPVGAKVMSLQDPAKKMSKSDDNPNSYILIMDSPDVIRKKIARAVTDSIGVVNYSDEQPGVKNLLDILIAIKGYSKDEVVSLYEGKGYAELKKDVADAIIDELSPIQERVNSLLKNKKALEEIYKLGAEKANYAALKNLRKMQKKIGLIPR